MNCGQIKCTWVSLRGLTEKDRVAQTQNGHNLLLLGIRHKVYGLLKFEETVAQV